jgi:quercetin dioxygenase-like cupin family protein
MPGFQALAQRKDMRSLLPVFALMALTAPVLSQETGTAKPNPPVLKEVTTEFPKGEQLEYRVLTATLEPGTFSPWHTHLAPVAVYVVSGTFTLEIDGGQSKALSAGEGLLEPINVKVRAANHGNEPAEVVIFQVSEAQDPFLVPTK